ncbi:TonB-dependent receptor [Sphingomonas profundi]|uniref:TonB-dependent receptor n=1 Tax=Alterirhizorhabdus profundi TaxID=2681549 RepID=UPI0012E8E06A|nr:TonB-dependent receptor [Sphingomonas profundi]
MTHSVGRRWHLAGGSALALALAASPAAAQTQSGGAPSAQAQDAAPPATAEAGSETGLADIVVTAQRRGEKLQDTPLTVSAITGDIAAQKGVVDTSDLQIVTPGLIFADSGIGPAIYLRGVGTQNTGFGDEGSIATYIDGVPISSLPAAFSSLANVERIEVLKGPQGTLFGRNATGGLINIITKTPSFTPSAFASVNYGSYDTIGGEAYVTAPLSSKIAFNASAYGSDQRDGWGKNVFNGKDVYKGYEYAFRSKLLVNLTDTTEILLGGDYSKRKDSSSAGAVDEGAIGIGGNRGLSDFYDVELSLQPLDENSTGGGMGRIQQDLGFAQLVSTTAYRFSNLKDQFDNDRGPTAIADVFFTVHDKQFTQELQLQSLPGSKITWIVGGFYLNAKTDMEHFTLVGAAVASAGGRVDLPARQRTRSLAGYAQVTVPLDDRTNVTGGLRYTDDRRRVASETVLPVFGLTIPNPDHKINFDKVTWRAAIDHHFNDDVMVFASYNRGFKSGIFNLLAVNDPAARPEVLDAFEVGVKSEFLDRRLRLNVSPFLYKYKDIQLSSAGLTASTLVNAAKATVKGVDADISVLPTRGLQFDVGAEYLHGRYDRFPNAPGTFAIPATCGPPPALLPGPRTGGNINCPIDASGFRMIRSPTLSFTLGARYELETSVGRFTATGNYFHSSRFPYEAGQRLKQPAYGVFNAQLGWLSSNEHFGVRVFGRNIFDKQYYTNRISSGGDTHASAAPATFGVALDVKY